MHWEFLIGKSREFTIPKKELVVYVIWGLTYCKHKGYSHLLRLPSLPNRSSPTLGHFAGVLYLRLAFSELNKYLDDIHKN